MPCRSRVRFRTRTGPRGAGPRPPSPIKRQELTPRGAGTAAATEPSGGTAELARAPHGTWHYTHTTTSPPPQPLPAALHDAAHHRLYRIWGHENEGSHKRPQKVREDTGSPCLDEPVSRRRGGGYISEVTADGRRRCAADGGRPRPSVFGQPPSRARQPTSAH